jgi:hypothetical protein
MGMTMTVRYGADVNGLASMDLGEGDETAQ